MYEPLGGPPRRILMNAGNREYDTEFELTAEFEGDRATGANRAYGNAAGTAGGRFRADENQGDITAIVNQRGG